MDNVKELMQGMTSEEMVAMFVDEHTLREPPYRLYQLNSKGGRFYYRYDENGEPTFYPSVTSILSQTMPESKYLIDWQMALGKEAAEAYMNERADYGTFMHIAFEKLIIQRSYDLDMLQADLLEYMKKKELPDNFIYHADELKKDVLAFAQFVKDYDVRPLAVEIALSSKEGYAGCIDLPCTMKASIKSDERIRAIIDFKSGRKGFYEDYEIQLHMYKDMWNENFPDLKIERVFNFAPKDWRKSPTYTLKDQTESKSAEKIPYLLALAKINNSGDEKVFTSVSGLINLDEDADFKKNVISMTLSEIVKETNTGDLSDDNSKDE